MSVEIEWDEGDVMRAFPQLTYEEATGVLQHMSAYWASRELGLLRRLCVESGAYDGEPDTAFEMGPDGTPRMLNR